MRHRSFPRPGLASLALGLLIVAGVVGAWPAAGRAAPAAGYQVAPLAAGGSGALRLVLPGQSTLSSQASPAKAHRAGPAAAVRPRLDSSLPAGPRAAAGTGLPSAVDLGASAQRDPSPAGNGSSLLAVRSPVRRLFEGIDQSNSDATPADAALGVGPAHVVIAVNTAWAILDKSGRVVADVIQFADWYAGVTPGPAAVFSSPKVLYDQFARRFVLIVLATDFDTRESRVLISVSPVGTAVGFWRILPPVDARLDGNVLTNNFIDAAGLGVDSRALYVTGNMFDFDTFTFRYAKLIVLDKVRLYSGLIQGSTLWDLTDAFGEKAFGLQPAHVFGSSSTGYLASARRPGNATVAGMTYWFVFNPPSRVRLERRSIPTRPYVFPPVGLQPPDVDDTVLETGDGRLYNLVFRGGFLYTAHTTGFNWGDGFPVAAIHYLEVSTANGRPRRELVYGGPEFDYSWPAIMPDAFGNLAIVFNRSGFDEYASLRITWRRLNDRASLLRASELLAAGEGQLLSGEPGLAFLGNYNSLALDPSTQRSWWGYGMYAAGEDFWSTRIGELAP